MAQKTFKERLLFSGRKLAISIKRNYFVIPLIFVCASCAQFMCILHVISPNFERVSSDYGAYNCIFIFIIALLSILSCVAYLNYALQKYGQKRPLHMLIIYYLMTSINIVLLIIIFRANQQNLYSEMVALNDAIAKNDEAAKLVYEKYVNYGIKTNNNLVVQLVLIVVSVILVTTAPFIQRALNKLKFKRIEGNEN